METKFTKGKWGLTKLSEEIIAVDTDLKISGNIICEMPTLRQSLKNWEYNALLISKAPEMFEMLQKLLNTLEENDKTYFDVYNETKQLLKEATEL